MNLFSLDWIILELCEVCGFPIQCFVEQWSFDGIWRASSSAWECLFSVITGHLIQSILDVPESDERCEEFLVQCEATLGLRACNWWSAVSHISSCSSVHSSPVHPHSSGSQLISFVFVKLLISSTWSGLEVTLNLLYPAHSNPELLCKSME